MKRGNMNTGRDKRVKMTRAFCSLSATVLSLFLILPVNTLQGADMTGKWGIGLHGGVYKLGLTDHTDIWTLGWLANGDVKYGVSRKLSLGVEGNWMQTYLADLSQGTRSQDGARATTDNVANGPRQRAFVVGLLAEYHFMPDKGWSPFLSFGSGMYIWRWADRNWNTLVSADPALVGTGTPPEDLDTCCYYLRDQELYAMAGLGLEFFPSQSLSFELGTKFRYLTHLFTNFRESRDIVGSEPGQLDLPKAVGEVYAGLTLYLGGKKECPPLACQASGNPKSGSPSLDVQFNGSVTGGCSPHSYSWDFGDGSSSSELSPRHTFVAAGNYTAQLTVTDSKGSRCQESVTSIIVGCPPLTSTASANPTSGTTPLAVQFSASGSGGCPPYTYSWDIGEGGTSTEQNPSHRIEYAGNYTARVTVTDSKGNRSQADVSYATTAAEFIPPPDKPLILRGVNFQSDKAILLENSKGILDRVAASLLEHPDVRIEVAGHCDAQNTEAHNLRLSDARAKAVRDYLIGKGVAGDRLEANGYGESQPIADNNTKEGRAENRRVELKRIQ